MMAFRFWFIWGAVLPLVTALFTNPDPIIRSTFHIGDRQTIRYNTTFTKYTIALWQQAPQGGAAKLGPILYQTTTGPQTNFDWLVQSYDFNIDDSNIFFFWLFEGDSSAQGNGSLPNSVSSYFIIAKAVTTSSTLPSSTISTSITSTSAATASTSPTSSTAAATTTSAVASSGSGGLSTGASAGIGIGVGLAVVAVAAIIAFVLWRRRTNKKVQQEQSAILERRDQDDKGAWQPHTPYTPHSAQTMMQPNTPYTQHSAQTAAPMYQQESYMSTSPPSSTSPYNTSKISPRYEASAEPTAVEIG